MVRIKNGWPHRRVKTAMGHVMWVRMSESEIMEREIMRLVIAATPLIMIWVFAWVGGMI